MYLLFLFSKVFWPCRNTNGYLREKGPENDRLGQPLQIGTPLYFLTLPAVLKQQARLEAAKVGSLLSRQMYVGGPHGLPKRICGLGTNNKKRLQQKPVYRLPRLTTKPKMF